MPFLEPFMPQTHTVTGFRLGPDLSRSIGKYVDRKIDRKIGR